MAAPFSKFTAKFGLAFALTLESSFFILKPTVRAQVLLKNRSGDFENSSLFERSVCLYVTASGNLERFQYLNFETDFLENENFFKKLEYRFLAESTNIENASFPYKTAISEASLKTNRMVSTKQIYRKKLSFARNQFIFLKILFQFKKLL